MGDIMRTGPQHQSLGRSGKLLLGLASIAILSIPNPAELMAPILYLTTLGAEQFEIQSVPHREHTLRLRYRAQSVTAVWGKSLFIVNTQI
jgi:hypothetical protein